MTTPIKCTFPAVRCIGSEPRQPIFKAYFQTIKHLDQFDLGRADRVRGMACRSTNGKYLDGWYSLPNSYKP